MVGSGLLVDALESDPATRGHVVDMLGHYSGHIPDPSYNAPRRTGWTNDVKNGVVNISCTTHNFLRG
jgi:hypothetical protein